MACFSLKPFSKSTQSTIFFVFAKMESYSLKTNAMYLSRTYPTKKQTIFSYFPGSYIMHVHFKFMLLSTAAAAKEGTFKNTSSCHYLMLCIYRGQEVKREHLLMMSLVAFQNALPNSEVVEYTTQSCMQQWQASNFRP